MKKLKNQKKLSKKALKNITGGNGHGICWEGLCRVRGTDDEYTIGPLDSTGFCC
jgi:bacteriocin-like protein